MYFTPCMPRPWGTDTANAHSHRTPCCIETQMVQRLGSKPMCLGRGPHRPLGSLLPTHSSCLSALFLKMIRGGCTPDEIEELEEAGALSDISHMPARVKCAVLGWHTMEEMFKGRKQPATTES